MARRAGLNECVALVGKFARPGNDIGLSGLAASRSSAQASSKGKACAIGDAIGASGRNQHTEVWLSVDSTPFLANRSDGQLVRPRAAQQSHAAVRSPSRLRIRI